MKTITDQIKKNPVVSYFIITFAITWGGLLATGGLGGMSGATWQSDPRLPIMVVAMLAGPSVTGTLLTGLVSGRAGLRELLSRLLRWRVDARWYAAALLPAPLMFAAVYSALSLISPIYLPGILTMSDKASLLLPGIVPALLVGFFEELGWTGFAVPRLRLRYAVLTTGLIMGVLWGAWHLLTNDLWIGDAYSGELPLALFLTANGLGLLLGQLAAYRVLLVWVYDRTGSLPVVMLMHASLSACTYMIGAAVTGVAFLTTGFVFGAAWWVIVAVVAVVSGGQLTRQPLYMEMDVTSS